MHSDFEKDREFMNTGTSGLHTFSQEGRAGRIAEEVMRALSPKTWAVLGLAVFTTTFVVSLFLQ